VWKFATVEERAVVDGFLLGMPKCGTTWLAGVLAQNPSIDFSDPKEPNILASHRGTFGRDPSDPDLDKYGRVFSGNGFRIDGSVHAFSCPLTPNRVLQINPQARFVVCLRDPVERAFSHWKMVRDNMADRNHGADWSDFETAWGDQRLKDDSIWSSSMARWLERFERESFLIFDSKRLRSAPAVVLGEINSHFGLGGFEYDYQYDKNANASLDRRGVTPLGRTFKAAVRIIPKSVRSFLASPLQKRLLNIYDLPIISKKGEDSPLTKDHYRICEGEVVPDLVEFERITGFSTKKWLSNFHHD